MQLALQKVNKMKEKEERNHDGFGFGTGVGAILLFLGSFASSLSASSASLFVPALTAGAAMGVSGGVVRSTPDPLPELVAVMEGTLPLIRGGLLMIPEGCVATEDVELDLAGDDGRCSGPAEVEGGDGAVRELAELRD